jgi:hypothetical protein
MMNQLSGFFIIAQLSIVSTAKPSNSDTHKRKHQYTNKTDGNDVCCVDADNGFFHHNTFILGLMRSENVCRISLAGGTGAKISAWSLLTSYHTL